MRRCQPCASHGAMALACASPDGSSRHIVPHCRSYRRDATRDPSVRRSTFSSSAPFCTQTAGSAHILVLHRLHGLLHSARRGKKRVQLPTEPTACRPPFPFKTTPAPPTRAGPVRVMENVTLFCGAGRGRAEPYAAAMGGLDWQTPRGRHLGRHTWISLSLRHAALNSILFCHSFLVSIREKKRKKNQAKRLESRT